MGESIETQAAASIERLTRLGAVIRGLFQATLGPAHPPAHLRLTPVPAPVAPAQGGLTLGPNGGEGEPERCMLSNNLTEEGTDFHTNMTNSSR